MILIDDKKNNKSKEKKSISIGGYFQLQTLKCTLQTLKCILQTLKYKFQTLQQNLFRL